MKKPVILTNRTAPKKNEDDKKNDTQQTRKRMSRAKREQHCGNKAFLNENGRCNFEKIIV